MQLEAQSGQPFIFNFKRKGVHFIELFISAEHAVDMLLMSFVIGMGKMP
jgi:hypothetical protein